MDIKPLFAIGLAIGVVTPPSRCLSACTWICVTVIRGGGLKTTQSGRFTLRTVWFRRERERKKDTESWGEPVSQISALYKHLTVLTRTSYQWTRTLWRQRRGSLYSFLSKRRMKPQIKIILSNFFFEYETPRQVLVRNKKVAVACRIIQMGVLGYIIG